MDVPWNAAIPLPSHRADSGKMTFVKGWSILLVFIQTAPKLFGMRTETDNCKGSCLV